MMTRTVNLPGHAYDILIDKGALRHAGDLLGPYAATGGPVAVVTDTAVWGLYGEALVECLRQSGMDAHAVVLPPGEGNKTLDGLGALYDAFTEMKLKRDGLAVALGGGVIGDLCGFAAATYLRGIAYVQMPTTLLAQVDSSVGGKTAINLPQGKNLAGAFYQPRLTLIDPDTLSTLPARELACGMAEVVKYGAIRDSVLFAMLQDKRMPADMAEVIGICCGIKADMVERDERDTGERMLLNFGHTFGHAIEKAGGYALYNHGEAVAIGMVIAAEIGQILGQTQPGTADMLREMLRLHGLGAQCPYGADTLLPDLETDKKSNATQVRMVLLRQIGDAFVYPISFGALGEAARKAEARWRI